MEQVAFLFFSFLTCGTVTVNFPLIYSVNSKPGSSNSIQKLLHLQSGTFCAEQEKKETACQ